MISGATMRMIIAAAALVSIISVASAQPNTLTLACKGTTSTPTMPEAKSEPISMGIIVNFAARTVQGFGFPGFNDPPVNITAVNDVTLTFRGQQAFGPFVSSISGSIDRVTGDAEATFGTYDPKTSKTISQIVYALQCRPAQRIF